MTLLAQECLEKYADEIALRFVFPVPAEAGISAGTSFCCLGRFYVFVLELHQYSSSLLRFSTASLCCSSNSQSA
ncbi:hypothetical protein V6N12_065591 [Hibiscus sabdariffa]|uniref:Uncharacterized protein n=1 Tax=Hibiscus sabdariffa TaxID=183260 RepID=A0ABR2G964_9ROSI